MAPDRMTANEFIARRVGLDAVEIATLLAENAQLRARIAELEAAEAKAAERRTSQSEEEG